MKKRIKYKIIVLIIVSLITVIRYMFFLDNGNSSIGTTSNNTKLSEVVLVNKYKPKNKSKDTNRTQSKDNNGKVDKALLYRNYLELSEEDFSKRFILLQKNAPTIAKLKGLSKGEVHHTPEVLTNYALKLANIKNMIKNNGLYYEEGKRLYLRCTVNFSLPDTIRALCINHIQSLMKDQGEALNIKTYPENIRYLVEKLK